MAKVNSVVDTINDLKNAKENYERIRNEYKDTPELIGFYLPSANFLVNELSDHLKTLIESETNVIFDENKENVEADIWIRLEGESFKGKGQIGVIGSYLQKLNTANKQAVNLIANIQKKFENAKDIIGNVSSLDLVSTTEGSFKLGLKKTDINTLFDYEQLNLFDEYKNETEVQKSIYLKDLKDLSLQGIKLIANTVESSEDDNMFKELKERYGENDLKKLIHYTKELVPSMRSNIDKVSFESNDTKSFKTVEATKETRKSLIRIEKTLASESTFVNGQGWIRAVDMDNFTGTIRPLHFKDIDLKEIACKFSVEKFSSEDVASFIDKFVYVDGFVIYNQHQEPIRLEIDEIALDNITDIE